MGPNQTKHFWLLPLWSSSSSILKNHISVEHNVKCSRVAGDGRVPCWQWKHNSVGTMYGDTSSTLTHRQHYSSSPVFSVLQTASMRIVSNGLWCSKLLVVEHTVLLDQTYKVATGFGFLGAGLPFEGKGRLYYSTQCVATWTTELLYLNSDPHEWVSINIFYL